MKIFTVFLVLLLSAYAMGVVSFDAERELIDDVLLVREADQKFLQLSFAAPVRVVGNYPKATGDILQVKLRVIAIGQFAENISLMEEIGMEEGKEIHMTNMYYEGDVPGGPFLVMKFDRPVKWEVTEGDGLLGMYIFIKEV